MDPRIEAISSEQASLVNHLLLSAADSTVAEPGAPATVRERRREQADALRERLVGGDAPLLSLDTIVERWWQQEQLWLDESGDSIPYDADEAVLYRLSLVFGRNHSMCPFVLKRKSRLRRRVEDVADADMFEKIVAAQFDSFLARSTKVLGEGHKLLPRIDGKRPWNLDTAITSARYRLLSRDRAFVKGAVFGVLAGVATTFVLGPVVGTYIGKLAGLSGAAATSYGLALLGGGSLASGGFGMAGGSFVIGVLFGGGKAATELKECADTELIDLCRSVKNLPIALALGRRLSELGFKKIPGDIRKKIIARARELEDTEIELTDDPAADEARRNRVIATAKVYESAKQMAKKYWWISGYDVLDRLRRLRA